MKRRKGLERVLAMTLAAFLSFTTIANDYAIVNAEEIGTTGTETVQNAENNTTGGDTAATQSQQDTAAGTGGTEQKSGGTSTGTATSTQSGAVTTTGTSTETTTETATETTTETTTETKTEAEVKKPVLKSAGSPYSTGNFSVAGGTGGTDYSYDSGTNTLTVLTATPLVLSGGVNEGLLILKTGARVTLKGLTIFNLNQDVAHLGDGKDVNHAEALRAEGTDIQLTIEGSNELTGGGNPYNPGIRCSAGNEIEISGNGSLFLKSSDPYNAPGIGTGGKIVIDGGNLDIYGGVNGETHINGGQISFTIYDDKTAGGTISINNAIVRRVAPWDDDSSSIVVYGNAELMQDIMIGGTSATSVENRVKTMTVSSGAVLNVPAGKTITNEGSLVLNGFITGGGTITGSGTITPDILQPDATVITVNDLDYTGSALTPSITVSENILGRIIPVDKSEYTFGLSYRRKNTDSFTAATEVKKVGTYRVTVKNENGTVCGTKDFLVKGNDSSTWMNDYSYTLNGGDIICSRYNGTAKKIEVPAEAVINGDTYNTVLQCEQSGESATGVFQKNTSIESIKIDKGVRTGANCECMFWGCTGMTSADIADLDTKAATSMREMFKGCEKLTSLDVSHFNTANLKEMQAMFSGCSMLKAIDLSKFSTGNIAYAEDAFGNCALLEYIDMSRFDYSKLKDHAAIIFSGCTSLKKIRTPYNTGSDSENLPALPATMYDVNGTAYKKLPQDLKESVMLCTGDTRHKVSFYDKDGKSVSSENVFDGEKVREIELPGYKVEIYTSSNLSELYDMNKSVSEDMKLYVKKTPLTYTVSYGLAGGTNAASNPASYTIETVDTVLAAPVRTGYIFSGWTGSNGNTPQTAVTITKGSYGNKSYTANWSIDPYNISYDLAGGTNAASNPVSYTIETADTVLAAPVRTGYAFSGWTGSNGNTPQTAVTIAKGSHGNKSYTANWTPITYQIAYDANGGSGTMNDQSVSYGQSVSLIANAFVRSGYTFTGWNIRKDGSGSAYANSANMKNLKSENGAKVTLYAQWTPITYQIAYDANGGSGTVNDQSVTYDQSFSLNVNAFTREGYTYTGWNIRKDGSGMAYEDLANVKNLVSENGAKVTLYAQWTPISYQIAYDANGGSGTMNDQSVSYDQSVPLSANTFVRSGYTYTGWNVKEDGSGKAYVNLDNVKNLVSENGTKVTLYAQWLKNADPVPIKPAPAPAPFSLNDTTGNGFTFSSVPSILSHVYRIVSEQHTDISKDVSIAIKAQTYDGFLKKPALTVMNGKSRLTEGVDYEVSFTKNINAGKATVIVKGIGRYKGTQLITFTINKKKFTKSGFIVHVRDMKLTGTEAKSPVTVYDRKRKKYLRIGRDYTVTYIKDNKTGTAKVIVTATARSNYSGKLSKSYNVSGTN
jgi:uncharacterized repeat protein (TIGR02543 family)